MRKYLVIGNPIDHSLSPKLHNYWLKKYNIDATYEKKLFEKKDLKNLILEIKEKKIQGINITVPFKKNIYEILMEDVSSKVSSAVVNTKSVNTVKLDKNGNIFGDNTDVEGFKKSLEHINYKIKGKTALVLGAGGVVPSILEALNILKKLNKKFDLIFIDPPFKEEKINVLLEFLLNLKILKTNGVIIIHRNKKINEVITEKLNIIETRDYGISKIILGN